MAVRDYGRDYGRGKEVRWRGKREEVWRREADFKAAASVNNSGEGDSITFFFSNFPDSHGEHEMFRIFRKWARVKEVFISRRPNRWGRRYGFVRFYPGPNEAKLEKQLDRIHIGNFKLYVNVPKYRRAEIKVMKRRPSTSTNAIFRVRSPHGKNKENEGWHEHKTVRKGENLKPNQSYAEVVCKSVKDRWTGPAFETTSNAPAWLVSSAVGWMSPDISFESLSEEFVKGGMSSIKLRGMGDNLVLLTPKAGESMDDIIKLNKEWFVSLFDDIEPWSESYVAEHKMVWVRCYGIPLTLWNEQCFSKVIGEVASLVKIDEPTRRWENLEYARLQVRLRKACKAEMVKDFRINGQLCNIVVIEEITSNERGVCSCLDDHYASSDSISSSDTVVEETCHSKKSSDEEDDLGSGGMRRDEVSEAVGQTPISVPANRKFVGNKALSDKGC
ncbi:uncharacterized protein [Phaseolus vulgaris]|uniref:uncharacterized protein n=1 Tax=Phaseolus vulgaris TaxID=3885 RepID=UPI0035CB4BAE